MMRVEAYRPEHLRTLELQEAQSYFGIDTKSEDYAKALQNFGNSFTALDGDRIIACAGCVEIWDNRAMAWALVSKDAGRHMLGVHRAVSGFLMAAKWRRVEAYVDAGFDAGMRWMDLLGFRQESPEPMRAFRPDGGDCYMFARTKNG